MGKVPYESFQSTIWQVIRDARGKNPRALETLVQKYRQPVVAYIQRTGLSEHDAEDLAQEVFLRISNEEFLRKVDPSRGRFRNIVIKVTRHVISEHRRRQGALKRGGVATHVSLSQPATDGGAPLEELLGSPDVEDEQFDRLWLLNILRLAMERLRRECKAADRPYYEALALHLHQNLEYEQIARKMGKKIHDVKNYLHRAKLKLMEHMKEEIAAYAGSREEFEEEANRLLKLLG